VRPPAGQRCCGHHRRPPRTCRERLIYRGRWRRARTWETAKVDGYWGREGRMGWVGGVPNCHLPACPQVSIGRYRDAFVNQGISRGIEAMYLDWHSLLKDSANSGKGEGGLSNTVKRRVAGSVCGRCARPTLAGSGDSGKGGERRAHSSFVVIHTPCLICKGAVSFGAHSPGNLHILPCTEYHPLPFTWGEHKVLRNICSSLGRCSYTGALRTLLFGGAVAFSQLQGALAGPTAFTAPRPPGAA